jgi:hypothetical protein
MGARAGYMNERTVIILQATPHRIGHSGQIDPSTLEEVVGIADARRLSATQVEVLCRYISGAVRPNRDRPIWDMCWLVVEIAAALQRETGRSASVDEQCISMLLAGSDRVQALLNRRPSEPDSQPQRRWSATGLGCLLAFADFVLTHEDCRWFPAVRQVMTSLAEAPPLEAETVVKAAVSEFSRRLRNFRRERLLLSQHERQVGAILAFFTAHGRSAASLVDVTDLDIFGYWEGALSGEDRMLYQTAVQQFLTLRTVVSDMLAQAAFVGAPSLDALPGDRVELLATDEAPRELGEPIHAGLAGFLRDGSPQDVKVLTGTEREQLLDLVDCGDFVTKLPLTVLRYISFGAVQSGISNYLRRGGGGADLGDRVTCRDAESYPDMQGQYRHVLEHLNRLLLVTAYLAAPAGAPAQSGQLDIDDIEWAPDEAQQRRIASEGLAESRKLKRKGFSGDKERLKAVLPAVSGQLVGLKTTVEKFLERCTALERSEPLVARFDSDRQLFCRSFTLAYLGATEA